MSITNAFQRAATFTPEEGMQRLFCAVASGEIEAIRELARAGVPVDCRNDNGDTPLLFAASCGNTPIVRELLEMKADPNAVNHEGLNVLWFALRAKNSDVVNILLENGAHTFDIMTKHRYDLLYKALQAGCAPVVEAALAAGVKANEVYGERREHLVHPAARGGHTAIVKMLIEAGANVNATDKDKHSVLRAAMESGNAETVMAVLDAGADTHNKSLNQKSGLTVTDESFSVDCDWDIATAVVAASKKFELIEKAQEGDAAGVHKLLEDGVFPDGYDRHQKTALFYACEQNNAEIVADLIKHKVDVNKRVWAGDLPITAACWNNGAQVIPLLCKAGASVFDKNGIGEPAADILKSDPEVTGLNEETRAVILKCRNDEIRKVTSEAAHAIVPVKTVGKFRLKMTAPV
jgi:ankyrin repeat protein